jgi:DNA-binding Lrp family transcriptional regulator
MKKGEYLISYGKKVELDEKDEKILEVLDKKSRSSIADISRKTGIPRDTVLYRMKKMEEKKVIRFYHTALNPSILGCFFRNMRNFSSLS